ncbi:MAG TPA: hypothetical protein VM529_17445 [Gemmata sp.]|nr:hypothetical protein [Gemmata sp.]
MCAARANPATWGPRPARPLEWWQEPIREYALPDIGEDEWLRCNDRPLWMLVPFERAMLTHDRARRRNARRTRAEPKPDRSPACGEWSGRKHGLLVCAACRLVWHLLAGRHGRRCRGVIEALERFLEGEGPLKDYFAARERVARALHVRPGRFGWHVPRRFARYDAAEIGLPADGLFGSPIRNAIEATMVLPNWAWVAEYETFFWSIDGALYLESAQDRTLTEPQLEALGRRGTALLCDAIRDIFGNPFRPVAFDRAWRTDTAVSLARGMYESRDFGAMPILADSLQDAGCTSDVILTHCQQPGLHARGCWVVDLVLGKS